MPAILIREIRKPEQNETANPAQLYKGSRPEFRGMVYTGRNRRTEYTSNADKPSPQAIQSVAEMAGYMIFTIEIE